MNVCSECSSTLSTRAAFEQLPAYTYWYGCVPTAVGMMLGYWDSHGYSKIVPGSAQTMTQAVKDMMASPAHIVAGQENQPVSPSGVGKYWGNGDYRNSPSYPKHQKQPDCLADYMKTIDAFTYIGKIVPGTLNYLQSRGQEGWTSQKYTWDQWSWKKFVKTIDRGIPVLGLVDNNGDGHREHAVPIVGYDTETRQYACYNTWDAELQWFDFAGMKAGQEFGIESVRVLTPPPAKVKLTVLDAGAREGGRNRAAVQIKRVGGPDVDMKISLSITGRATNGTDFIYIPKTITIPRGQTSITLDITALSDDKREGPEDVILTLRSGSDYVPVPSARFGRVQIFD